MATWLQIRFWVGFITLLMSAEGIAAVEPTRHDERITELLGRMTLAEKIGQMTQVNSANGTIPVDLHEAVKAGHIGSILNEVNVGTVNELQRIAIEENRLGIPLLMGRDVVHGFKTVLPIPLGQAATWSPELVQSGARMAALEAASSGINWTFAPMIDVTRDPRWGRIAESLGEDPYLHSVLGSAMIRGFQGKDLAKGGHQNAEQGGKTGRFSPYRHKGGHRGGRVSRGRLHRRDDAVGAGQR